MVTVRLLLFDSETRVLHPFLLFHAAILKPDFHLRLVESQRRGDLDAPRASQVLVEVEFFLEFGQLFVCEVRSTHVRLTRKRREVGLGCNTHRSNTCYNIEKDMYMYMYVHEYD